MGFKNIKNKIKNTKVISLVCENIENKKEL